ncbi:ankyrin repeat-containing domain protein [Mycena olivaceomarginata]|nr:ankyrin repeat-containing domain protein [Mycena olivaceomarginata]
MPREANEFQTNYYISHVSGGTGGAGGSGGNDGGRGGFGEGPRFHAGTMNFIVPDQDRGIVEWASPLNFFPRQDDILRTRQPGTGEWLFEDPLFERWKAGKFEHFGVVECLVPEKTVLASIVVNDLRTNLADENTGVAAVYLDHKATTKTHSLENLLAAIWRQFALGKPMSSCGTHPSLEETHSVVQSAVSDCVCVFIVVDALDEYPDSERDALLRCLWKLGPIVRLMFTSRPHISIGHIIPQFETLDVRATEEDIRKYVDGRIESSHRLSGHINKSPSLRESIEERIVKRSDGMFLLAKLHMDSLVNKQNVAAVRDALTKLSSNLNSAYDDIVNRINQQNEEDRQLAWRTLSWVVHAKKPLQPSRLKEALAVEPEAIALDPERQTDMDIVVSVCAGLVVVDEVDNTVRLIHYTTQIYLQSDHAQSTIFPHAQSEITLTCISYMSLTFKAASNFLQNQFLLFTRNPFLHYTVEYCLVHARGEPETDQNVQDQILLFLTNHLSVWWGLRNWRLGERQSAPDRLRITMAFHLVIISKRIITQYGGGIVLQESVARGDADEVRVLVQDGIDLEKDYTALQEAVIRGNQELVSILLVHDNWGGRNSTNSQGHGNPESLVDHKHRTSHGAPNQYSTALYQASQIGNTSIVELLIQHGADVNGEGGHYGGALHIASKQGQEFLVRMLLKHGANTNVGGDYGSALQVAARQGHKSIVQLLLRHGADVNAEGGEDGNALQAAVGKGHEDIVRLLLNTNDGGIGETLQLAFDKGNEFIIKLLLEHWTGVSISGGEFSRALRAVSGGARGYNSVLQAASSMGHEALVSLLLREDSGVIDAEVEYDKVFKAGVSHGHQGIVKLLIEHVVEVAGRELDSNLVLRQARRPAHEGSVKPLLENSVNESGNCTMSGSLLHLAAREEDVSIVKLLLECGAKVVVGGGSALQAALEGDHKTVAASHNGHESVVRLLLECGVDPNTRPGMFDSALQAAAREGHEAVVRLLLDRGADVNGEGGRALWLASRNGRKVVAKVLLEHGANVNTQWIHGGPLHAAVLNGDDSMARLLLEHGADVKQGGVDDDTALRLACRLGEKKIARLLLQHGADR